MKHVILMRTKAMRKRNTLKVPRSYFKTCPYCQYSGSDWPDSGECPSCKETS